MLVGDKSVTLGNVLRNCRSQQQALDYATSLVPPGLRHVRAIVDNQRYFLATLVNGASKIPYVQRRAICDALTNGIQVHGVVNELYDYGDLLLCLNEDMWNALLKREEDKR